MFLVMFHPSNRNIGIHILWGVCSVFGTPGGGGTTIDHSFDEPNTLRHYYKTEENKTFTLTTEIQIGRHTLTTPYLDINTHTRTF